MANTTGIEWADSTFNPWIGCTAISPGCANCYAAVSTPARSMHITWGPGQQRHRTSVGNWKQPFTWDKQRFMRCTSCRWRGPLAAESIGCGNCKSTNHLAEARRRVFCSSLADWLDNEVPIEWLVDLLALIRDTPHLDWLLLTKRIGNWKSRLQQARDATPNAAMIDCWLRGMAPPNIWLGATVVDQTEADRDIVKLRSVPARVRFVSIEPMLGPIDIRKHMWPVHASWPACFSSPQAAIEAGQTVTYKRQALLSAAGAASLVNWVVAGGESGPSARPMHPDWPRSLRDQCAAADVPFLFKQWGSWRAAAWFDGPDADRDDGDDFVDLDRTDHQFVANDGRTWDTVGGRYMYPPLPLGHWCLMVNEGKRATGRILDGDEHNAFPGE